MIQMLHSRQKIIDALKPVLQRHPVSFAVLHGSVAADQATPVSDVDVAVYVEDRDNFLQLVAELDEAVPGRRVDVMNLARQPALVYYRVLATGDLIHVTDEEFYYDEKFRVMREYLDFKPMHDRILRDMERRIDAGAYGRIAE
jgi:predicted nucleotidyltransferase